VPSQNLKGRESRDFLLIQQRESLADVVSKLLGKPDPDWILVDWKDDKEEQHYAIFKHRFFVQRFVTPNLPSSENIDMTGGLGEALYRISLARVLTKSSTARLSADKTPRLQVTNQQLRTAIGRAALQHAITRGEQEEKTKWDVKNFSSALEATLARVVVDDKSAKPRAILYPAEPVGTLASKRPVDYKILVQDPGRRDYASHPKTSTKQKYVNRLRRTLATVSYGAGGLLKSVEFDPEFARILAEGVAKLDPNEIKEPQSKGRTASIHVPIEPLDLTSGGCGGGSFDDSPDSNWDKRGLLEDLRNASAPDLSAPSFEGNPDESSSALGLFAEEIHEGAGPSQGAAPAQPAAPEAPTAVAPNPPSYLSKELYAEIFCDPAHVVHKREFKIVVSLLLEKPLDAQTTGNVWLKSKTPDELHTLKVHLLMRGVSVWGELECSLTKGTTKQAIFELNAPEMPTDKRGRFQESTFELIRVNFYLNGRWSGEAQRNIELLRDENVPPCDRIPIPGEPLWRTYLNAEPGAEPPDLLVRIQNVGGDSFRWTMISPHANFNGGDEAHEKDEEFVRSLNGKPERYVADNFEWLAGRESEGINRENVLGACEDIYKNTPEAFKKAYWKLFREARQSAGNSNDSEKPIKFKTIQFISDEPCVPWELMRVVSRRDNVEPAEPDVDAVLLSTEYQVGRWLADSSCQLKSRIDVSDFQVSTSTYSKVPGVRELPWTAGERDYLSDENGPWKASPRNLVLQEIRDLLLRGQAQAIHFACHGEMDQAMPQRSRILLEDDLLNFRTTAVDREEVRRGIGKYHPLVFLNACQLAGEGKVLSLGSGWPRAFLDIGASAFVGPLWSVQDESARDAAKHFYQELSEGKSLGEALRTLRMIWLNGGSVTFLAYTLYGDPTARVVRLPAPASPQAASEILE
jgi:hypothetical protein